MDFRQDWVEDSKVEVFWVAGVIFGDDLSENQKKKIELRFYFLDTVILFTVMYHSHIKISISI